jgi:hypothetical protein
MRSACDNNSTMVITESNETDIYSPNWPNRYPPNSNCTWEIIAPHGAKIQLTMKRYHFDERYVDNNSIFIVYIP